MKYNAPTINPTNSYVKEIEYEMNGMYLTHVVGVFEPIAGYQSHCTYKHFDEYNNGHLCKGKLLMLVHQLIAPPTCTELPLQVSSIHQHSKYA